MEIALFSTIVIGLIAVLLSWELDKSKKKFVGEKKTQEDKIYKLSVFKEIQKEIAYTLDTEKVIDVIMANLESFFIFSTASSVVIKNDRLIFKTRVEEQLSNDYIKSIEERMISSLNHIIGNLPAKIDRNVYGVAPNNAVESTYFSSFHIPIIVRNKVVALIHLSSTKENLYLEKDMEDLYGLVELATSSLTHLNVVLDAEKNMLISLIESIKYGIIMADNKNNLLLINDSAKKILGLIEENVSFFDVANILSQNLHLASIINDVIKNNKPYATKELGINDNRILDIFVAPINHEKVSVVLHNVAEYKKREISKEDLTNIMVHELRAPITTIKDSAELIITTGESLEKDKKLKFLEIIHQQAKRVLGQIGSILDTAKFDAGKLVLQKTKGDISKLIQDEIQTFMPQSERKNISLSFDILAKSLPSISFDEMRISQVIDNLLSNSLKFTASGGKIKVEIDYKVIPPVLDRSSLMEEFLSLDKYIVISVSDTGVGIAKEQQKFLFSKYAQAKNTPEKLATLGTGLGLYLVKGIIESHGGRIWVKSAPGQGTTFSFTLPADDDAKTSYDVPTPSSTPLSKLTQTVN